VLFYVLLLAEFFGCQSLCARKELAERCGVGEVQAVGNLMFYAKDATATVSTMTEVLETIKF